MNLLKELAQALSEGGIDKVPEGWKTARQYASESGVGVAHASGLLKTATEAGMVERKRFRVRAGSVIKAVLHYRKVPA